MDAKAPSQTKARLIILTIFVMGLAGGALTMNLYQRATSDPSKNGRVRGNIIEKMDQKLDLTPEQENQIRAILDETFGKYREIREEMDQNPEVKKYMPRFDEARQAGRERIRAVLTEEQKTEFEQMMKEQDEERGKHGDRRKK